MNYRFGIAAIFFFSALALAGCSTSNSSAPADNQAHPFGWIAAHSEAAATLADCTGCHGDDLTGSGNAVSCYSCHLFNTAPPFSIHPADWTDVFVEHRAYALDNTAESCAKCHGVDLGGSSAAPSCFSSSFDGLSCHAEGPGVAPHGEGASFLFPPDPFDAEIPYHGSLAKADLEVCQSCHGEIIPVGSSPRFNLGIYGITGNGCEGCHNDYTAHPSVGDRDNAHWYGATVTHANSGNLDACALCHGDNFEGNADIDAPACMACHIVDPVVNNEGCVSCHSLPPDSSGLAGNVWPNREGAHSRSGHSAFINRDEPQQSTCVRCHYEAGAETDNHFDLLPTANINFLRPDDPSDTITATSDGSNTTCTGNCHIIYSDGYLDWNHDNEPWY